MKGVPGLLMALALGVVGAFCNWFYIFNKAKDYERVQFCGVADTALISPGDQFKNEDFVPIPIPKNSVGKLSNTAVLYADRATVVGMKATRSYDAGELILRQDLTTAPPPDVKRMLRDDEGTLWVPVDTRTFVPSLVNPNDQISFIVPKAAITGGPTPAATATGTTERIGPFRVLALGNRQASVAVTQGSNRAVSQENVVAIAVKLVKGEFDDQARRLTEVLKASNNQYLQVFLHKKTDGL